MSAELICLVADKNIAASLDALLGKRGKSLDIRPISYEIEVHLHRDSGCYHEGSQLLRGLMGRDGAKGLIVFDQAWDGNPHDSALETEAAVRQQFQGDVTDRAEVVVIEPEIEAWVWSTSPHVGPVLGWESLEELRNWLRERGLWSPEQPKPVDPKAAMEQALRKTRIPRSSALYRQLASKVGLSQCRDPALSRLREILRRWFPVDS